MELDFKSIQSSLIGSAVYGAFFFVYSILKSWLSRRSFVNLTVFTVLLIVWYLLNTLTLFTLTSHNFDRIIIIVASLLMFLLLLLLLLVEFGSQRFVGIIGVDRQVKTGLSYDKALSLCKNRMSFLGLGASKLTRSSEFEPAILRCTHENPVRLLLLKPSDNRLIQAARRAKKDTTGYKRIVRNSLRIIKEMKDTRGVNIEVRFCNERPIFRLMFIDDSICLVSYYALGEGDGSQLPQVHLLKNPFRRRTVNSFYYAFSTHFDRIWEKSDRWNFSDYLEEDK